jgi:DNA helicase II / ATP-dependent DNA helicase PcrA
MKMGFCTGPLQVGATGARLAASRGLLPSFFGASPRARPASVRVAVRACAQNHAPDDGLSGLERLRRAQREIAMRRAQARGRSAKSRGPPMAGNQPMRTVGTGVSDGRSAVLSGRQVHTSERVSSRKRENFMSTDAVPSAITATEPRAPSPEPHRPTTTSEEVVILRGDGLLPRRSASSGPVKVTPAGHVLIPTIADLCLTEPIDEFIRREACLPRITSVFSTMAARATAAAYADDSQKDLSSLVDKECLRILDPLNPPQRQAVVAEIGRPCLVFAGPGSGKTRVLTHRAAYLVEALGVHPGKILAVTFTNKAASEMKERIALLLGGLHNTTSADQMVVGTFHSICARFLRLYGLNTGIPSNFDILDAQDARAVISDILKEKSPQDFSSETAKEYTKQISMLKNDRGNDLKASIPTRAYARVEELRRLYDDKMRSMNKLDFDDLLLELRRLLVESEDARNLLQTRFQHVLVDEWQDSNTVQYDIVRILAENHRNLFVVGDSDQSIYKFRGADARNVSRLGVDFKDTDTVGLDENYRSTACIVQAAQAVIQVNKNRPAKAMTTSNEFGSSITVSSTDSCADEAFGIANRVKGLIKGGNVDGLSDIAIMYRVHSQSRALEDAFVRSNIPYRLIGGIRFYERLEVKDVLAYVRLVTNPLDDLSLKRAINTPPRGIGEKTVERLADFAHRKGTSMMRALDFLFSDNIEGEEDDPRPLFRGSALKRLESFLDVIRHLRQGIQQDGYSPDKTISSMLAKTNYLDFLAKRGDPDDAVTLHIERVRNVEELRSAAMQHENLESFLESVALVSDVHEVADVDGGVTRADSVSMMTLHGGKGLEFSCVFMCGMEEGLVPMLRDEKLDALEEERRLAYVGMTRAKRLLYFSWRERKLMHRTGQSSFYATTKPSRFLKDIPKTLVVEERSKLAKMRTRGAEPNAQASRPKLSKQWPSTSWTNQVSPAPSRTRERKVVTYGKSGMYAPAYEKREVLSTKTCKVGARVQDPNFGNGVVIASDAVSATRDDTCVPVRFADGQKKWVAAATLVVLDSTDAMQARG